MHYVQHRTRSAIYPAILNDLLEHSQYLTQAYYKLAMAFVNIDSKLGNQRVRKGELSQGVTGNGELANANNPRTKLGQGKDAIGKLADGNDTLCWHRGAVWTILEGNMKQR